MKWYSTACAAVMVIIIMACHSTKAMQKQEVINAKTSLSWLDSIIITQTISPATYIPFITATTDTAAHTKKNLQYSSNEKPAITIQTQVKRAGSAETTSQEQKNIHEEKNKLSRIDDHIPLAWLLMVYLIVISNLIICFVVYKRVTRDG